MVRRYTGTTVSGTEPALAVREPILCSRAAGRCLQLGCLALACLLGAALLTSSAPCQTGTQPTVTSRAAGPEVAHITGQVIGDLAYPGQPPLFMPTAVAVAGNRRIYIADGANDRIVWLNASGTSYGDIAAVAGQHLSRPMSLKIDPLDRLWIADTGNRRVVAIGLDNPFQRVLPVEQSSGRHAPNITDLAISPNGQMALLVDSGNHVLLQMDLETGRFHSIGQEGEEPGQFRYPLMIAATHQASAIVTDVANGRIQVLDSDGRFVRTIGTYGVQAGDLYRPGGVALDAAGRVWISDHVLGVVQVFSQDDGFLDVLRGADDQPLRFAMPVGLTFDKQGDLYVVELQASRIRRVRVQVPASLVPVAPKTQAGAPVMSQPRTCTTCHLDWIYPLNLGRGTELLKPIHSTLEAIYASRGTTCLSCHAGVVVDSRQVWKEHGHPTGTAPPTGMQVPETLPLADGMIACRTCHAAHMRSGAVTIANAVYLRVQEDPSELCIDCHSGFAAGPEAGMHPLGPMAGPIPLALRHPGDESVGNEVTCLVCHRAHGAQQKMLLALPGAANYLCRQCHAPQEALKGGPHDVTVHPQAWPALATVAGDICLACHRVHGNAKMGMFRSGLASGGSQADAACLACHPDAASAAAGNRSLVHPQAVTTLPASSTLPVVTAPAGSLTIACPTCHDPHQAGQGPGQVSALLGVPAGRLPDSLCLTCHPQMAGFAAAGHGPANLQPAGFTTVACQPCHLVHANDKQIDRPLLWSKDLLVRATASPLNLAADRYCVACHRAGGPAAVPAVSTHPAVWMFNLAKQDEPGFLPLFNAQGQIDPYGSLSCRTCHLAHGRSTPAALRQEAHASSTATALSGEWYLRVFAPASVCVNCHGQDALRRFLYFHDKQQRVASTGMDPATGLPVATQQGGP